MSIGIAVGTDTPIEALEASLERVFGYGSFRTLQRPLVEATLAGRDVLAVLPTGAGKSVCFQLPALLSTGVTLVVSPLISLMQDQVEVLRRRGAPAASLSSATAPEQRLATLRNLSDGSLRLLYVSPERLATPSFRALWRTPPIRLVVDEAHCISEWGHDFRPSYRHIEDFAALVGNPPIAAFTATATPATRADIETCLSLRRPFRVIASVDRPNVRWDVRRARSPAEALDGASDAVRSALRSDPRGSAIVYVPTRARAALVAETLRRLGVRAGYYHAGL
ncbi:MAG: ATP-dependent DNA helicase RecQ, partial [Gemmatimonadetes bacterium]|nr:ATP-dependent DNA helicase RecQ [Gemmatimonadota bacterium]